MTYSTRTVRLLTFSLAISGAACHRASAGTAVGDFPVSDGEPIQEAAWLAGHWEGAGLGGTNESLWSPPAGGAMMGVYRHVRDGKVVFYQFLTLKSNGETLVLSLKHFNPDMTGWEERTQSVEFPLIRSERDALYFDGMTYRRKGPHEREVTVMFGPDANSLRPEVFSYRRVQSSSESQ